MHYTNVHMYTEYIEIIATAHVHIVVLINNKTDFLYNLIFFTGIDSFKLVGFQPAVSITVDTGAYLEEWRQHMRQGGAQRAVAGPAVSR